MEIKKHLKRFLTKRLLLGLVVGGILGFAYYHFIGCNSGGCAITSNPYRMTGYGMLLGGLLLSK